MPRRTSRKHKTARRNSKKSRRTSLRRNADVNCEGLTFGQWYAAAGSPSVAGAQMEYAIGRLRNAWESGEDPSEHRALRSNSRKRSWHGPPPPHLAHRAPYVAARGPSFLPFKDPAEQGANREGLTWNEWRAAAGTGGLTTAVLLAAWRAGEDPTEYRAMKRNAKKTGRIADDTMIIPEIVADGVIEELQQAVDFALPREAERSLADGIAAHAQTVYEHNADFAKQLRAKGNKGRDTLYAFMRHWLASDVKKQHPAVFKKLPRGWGWNR